MTSNELVDKLESVSIRLLGKETEQAGRAIILYRESAIMLRQQAKEIAMLKQIIDANNLQSDVGQFIRPIDEPVAWMTENGTIFDELPPISGGLISLYTHPMRELTEDTECQYCKQGCFRCDARKALTDEEIMELSYLTSDNDPIDFARAILKKAGEK